MYVKVSLNQGLQSKEIKSKKTDTLSNGNAFNESFSFNKISNLDQISVRLTLIQPGIFGNILPNSSKLAFHNRFLVNRELVYLHPDNSISLLTFIRHLFDLSSFGLLSKQEVDQLKANVTSYYVGMWEIGVFYDVKVHRPMQACTLWLNLRPIKMLVKVNF